MSSITSALEIGLIGVVSAASALLVTKQVAPELVPETVLPSPLTTTSTATSTDDQPLSLSHTEDIKHDLAELPTGVAPSDIAPASQTESAPRPSSPPALHQTERDVPIKTSSAQSSDILAALGSPIPLSSSTSKVTHTIISPTSFDYPAEALTLPAHQTTQNLVPATLPTSSSSSSIASVNDLDEADSQASIRSIPPTPAADAFSSAPSTPFAFQEQTNPIPVTTELSRISSHSSNMSAPPIETISPEQTLNYPYVAVEPVDNHPRRSHEDLVQSASQLSVEDREREQQEVMDRHQRDHVIEEPVISPVGIHNDGMMKNFMPVPVSPMSTTEVQEPEQPFVSDTAINPNTTPYTAPVVNELSSHEGQDQSRVRGPSFDEQRVPVQTSTVPLAQLPVIQTANLGSDVAYSHGDASPASVGTPASTYGVHASPKDIAKISKSEHKRNKSISKILKQEDKDEAKRLELAIKELSRLQKNQRDAVAAESKAGKIQGEALKVERKAHERFLKEKALYDKTLAHLHTREEELEAHRAATLRQSQILGEHTEKVEQLRNAKAVDDRLRAEKLAELRR